jgi:hypothetical protein
MLVITKSVDTPARSSSERYRDLSPIEAKLSATSTDARGYLELTLAMDDFDRSSAVAEASALVGDRNQALEYLEQGYSDGDSELLFTIRNPALDSLRPDPRFKDLMRRLGLPK